MLSDILSESVKEKVTRIILATFRVGVVFLLCWMCLVSFVDVLHVEITVLCFTTTTTTTTLILWETDSRSSCLIVKISDSDDDDDDVTSHVKSENNWHMPRPFSCRGAAVKYNKLFVVALIIYPVHWTQYIITCRLWVSVIRFIVEWLRPQFFTDFYQILCVAWKCVGLCAYCLWDKLEVEIRF